MELDKRYIFNLWVDTKGSFEEKKRNVLTYVLEACAIDADVSPGVASKIEYKVELVCSYFKQRWCKHGRSKRNVLNRYFKYFEKPFKLTENILLTSRNIPSGRKSILFEESSNITKRKKTADIRNRFRSKELAYATQMKLREERLTDAAAIIREATQTTPSRATKIRDSWKQTENNPVYAYTDMEALALMVDSDLSVSQYNSIQSGAKKRNANIYPPYNRVLAAKKTCYPADEFITISDTEIEINLQQLLNLTSERIVEVVEEKLNNFTDAELLDIEMTIKYGMDGSTGNSEFNQVFENDDGSKTDSSIFMSALVPIKAAWKEKVLFQNPRPSSTRLCRPIHIQMATETAELAIRERDYLARQIEMLEPTKLVKNGRKICVRYNMLLTMVDGKICSALTETKAAARCYVCKATPKQMNNVDKISNLHVDESAFQFGLSILHAWIRFLEYFLKVSYRLEVKKWAPRGANKEAMLKRKAMIQQRFKVELGLHVDKPRAGGSGTSNTGNVARRFFENAVAVAEITGLNLPAIQRCGTILQVIMVNIINE